MLTAEGRGNRRDWTAAGGERGSCINTRQSAREELRCLWDFEWIPTMLSTYRKICVNRKKRQRRSCSNAGARSSGGGHVLMKNSVHHPLKEWLRIMSILIFGSKKPCEDKGL
jgi:hypothetical protein